MVGRAFDADHVRRDFGPRQKGAHLRVHSACAIWAVENLEALAQLAEYEARYIAATDSNRAMATDRAARCRKAIVLLRKAFPGCC